MDMHGSIANNLASAIRSARRLRGHPVHADTLEYWTGLIHHARRELADGSSQQVLDLTLELERELAERAN